MRDAFGKLKLKKGEKDKRMRALIKDGTRVYGDLRAASLISEADALCILPPDSNVKKSIRDNRWRCSWTVYKISRSWAQYGEAQSLLICAAYLWHEYKDVQEVDCPFDFLKDITWD